MIENLHPVERIVSPGNVIIVPDAELSGVNHRIITSRHDVPNTKVEIGEVDNVGCFALEEASPIIYSDPTLTARLLAEVNSQNPQLIFFESAAATGKPLFFVDMHLSGIARKFEERRYFLKAASLVGFSVLVRSTESEKAKQAGDYALAAGSLYILGPKLASAALWQKKPIKLDTVKGKTFRAVSRLEHKLHPDEHGFTIALRNALIAYKTRTASRLVQQRSDEPKTNARTTVLGIGEGHEAISSMFGKSDNDLLSVIKSQLKKLHDVDPKDSIMWESLPRIVEIRYTKIAEDNADCVIKIVTPEGKTTYIGAHVYDDPRLKVIVEGIRSTS